jgi:RNA-directed DNA polymerase
MAERGLQLSEEKTLITHISDDFDFLGCNIRKYDGKLLITPSGKNIKAFIGNIREVIKNSVGIRQEDLIRRLNPKIRGWVDFHKHNVSSKAFAHVDYQIWNELWQWANRRHDKKGRRWVAAKYWHRIGNRTWTFSVPTRTTLDNGEPYFLKLVYATDTLIARWTKIKSAANPFDEDWALYFEERETDKMRIGLKGRKVMTKLYYAQKGLCPVCGQKLTLETGVKIHEQRVNGKLVKAMVHPKCHSVIHANIPEYSKQPAL